MKSLPSGVPQDRPAGAKVTLELNKPLLTTRELFALKGFRYATLAGLSAMNSDRVEDAMSIEDGGIGLDRTEYPTV